jgi:2-hydroxymuconate-semialdehyde hydrolase
VLLHGGIECGGAYWAPVAKALAERYRLVVPDIPGLGVSEPVHRLDVNRFSGWFTDLLHRTGTERPTLVAHSLLGSMAARFAVDHGDALGRLVLYGAPAVGPYRMPMRLRYVAVRAALRPTLRNHARFERFVLLDRERTRALDSTWFDAFSANCCMQARRRSVRRTGRRLVVDQTRPMPVADLRRISVPTALLWGRNDRMVPIAIAEHARATTGWPLHVVESAAHAPHMEQPARFLGALANAMGAPETHV